METAFEYCDFTNPKHLEVLAQMINEYMADPMGDADELLDKKKQLRLVDGLANHPSCLCVFILLDGEIAGVSTCFINFSTFQVKSYLYVHDLFIRSAYRGKGLGKKLLQELVNIAKERDYCKVTLEVRNDNRIALYLYRSMGFKDTEPAMYFWTKRL